MLKATELEQRLDELLAASPLRAAHRDRLAALGMDDGLLRTLGLGSWSDDRIIVPVRGIDGALATLHLHDIADPFSPAVADLAAMLPELAGRASLCVQAGAFLPVAQVARRGGRDRGRDSDRVMFVADGLTALIAAERLDITAISQWGIRHFPEAFRAAAQLHARRLVFALPRTKALEENVLRQMLIIGGTRVSAVDVASWPADRSLAEHLLAGGSLKIQGTRPIFRSWSVRGLPGPCAPPPGLLGGRLLEQAARLVATPVMRMLIRLAQRYAPVAPPPRTPSDEYLRALSTVPELERIARAGGTPFAVIGGIATDAMLGFVLRPRKDVDIALLDPSPETVDRMARHLEELGFKLTIYRRGSSDAPTIDVRAESNGSMVELLSLRRAGDHALFSVIERTYLLPVDAFAGPRYRLFGYDVPTLDLESHYLIKYFLAYQAGRLMLRSELEKKGGQLAELRALDRVVSHPRLRRLLRSRGFVALPFAPLTGRQMASDLRRMAERLVARLLAPPPTALAAGSFVAWHPVLSAPRDRAPR